jgi:hypothetical protein
MLCLSVISPVPESIYFFQLAGKELDRKRKGITSQKGIELYRVLMEGY